MQYETYSLARGFRLHLRYQPYASLYAASYELSDASLFVTAEVPVLAKAFFNSNELSEFGNEIDAQMLVGYQPIIMPADTKSTIGDLTWKPIKDTVLAFNGLLSKSFRHSKNESVGAEFEIYAQSTDGSIIPDQGQAQCDWRVNGAGILVQRLNRYWSTCAMHRQAAKSNIVSIQTSMRPHIYDGSNPFEAGILFNYTSKDEFSWVYCHLEEASLYLTHTRDGKDRINLELPGQFTGISPLHVKLLIKQLGDRNSRKLLIAYLITYDGGGEIHGTVSGEQFENNFPADLIPGSRLGLFSRSSAEYESLEIAYSNSKETLIPITPPRMLTHLTLKRSLLGMGPRINAGPTSIRASEDFNAWFWLFPSTTRFGYEPPYYPYEYGPWFEGIGASLL